MEAVIGTAIVVMVLLGLIWWLQYRQKRQIRHLLARLEALEENDGDRSGPGTEEAEGRQIPETESSPPGDVLAGYTTYIERVILGGGDGTVSLGEQAILKIHDHLEESYRPAQLADDLYISLRTLERGLSETFDCSPGQLITAMKMREARRLLGEEDARVNEVASRLGFSSPFYFSRRFRTFFGSSPSEYRREVAGGR